MKQSMMVVPDAIQSDEALHLLAEFYARRVASLMPSAARPLDTLAGHACERVRDTLLLAPNQERALEHLTRLAEQAEPADAGPQECATWSATVQQAADLVRQVIQAGGNPQVLLAGETDGFRHLCRRCCQVETNVARVRYFVHAERRPLLKAEVSNRARSLYDKCQVCEQVLVPEKWVVLVSGGTSKHQHPGRGSCEECNRAHVAFLAGLYECEEATLALRVPSLATIAAPSAAQVRQRALQWCWEQGWYLLLPPSHEEAQPRAREVRA